ncbi:flippase [Patescibacteria group bacterium]|nr:flippase [Patescibacteria group bacterium]
MSTIKHASKNALWLTIAEIVAKVVAFISVILITRYLTKDSFGQYTFVMSMGIIFGVLANFGFGVYVTREIARSKEKAGKIVGNLLSLKLILSGVVLVLLFLTAQFLDKPSYVVIAIYVVSFLTVFDALRSFLGGVFQAYEKMGYLAVVKVGERLLYLVLVLVAIYLDKGIVFIVGSAAAASFIFALVSFALVHYKFTPIRLRWDKVFILQILLGTVFFLINDIFIVVFFRIDTVMLSLMTSDALTATYSAAYNLIYAVTFIPGVLSAVLFPVLTRFYKTNKDVFKSNLTLIFKYFMLVSLPVMAFFIIFSEKLIVIIYKEKYIDSVPIFQLLTFGLGFVFLNFIFSTILNTVNKQKLVAASSFIAMILNIVLNFILIPQFTMYGAAVATIITEFTFCLALALFVHKQFKIVNTVILKKLLFVCISLVVAIVCAYIARFNPYVSFTVFLLVFAVLLFFFRIFAKKDKDYILEALHLK